MRVGRIRVSEKHMGTLVSVLAASTVLERIEQDARKVAYNSMYSLVSAGFEIPAEEQADLVRVVMEPFPEGNGTEMKKERERKSYVLRILSHIMEKTTDMIKEGRYEGRILQLPFTSDQGKEMMLALGTDEELCELMHMLKGKWSEMVLYAKREGLLGRDSMPPPAAEEKPSGVFGRGRKRPAVSGRTGRGGDIEAQGAAGEDTPEARALRRLARNRSSTGYSIVPGKKDG
jgi:hypothetical protein